MSNPEPITIELAAKQLTDYLYPKGGWIGTAWIQTDVLVALSGGLYRAIERKRRAEEREEAHKERQYDGKLV